MKQTGKNLYSDRDYELLAMSFDMEIEARTRMAKLVMEASIAITGLIIDLSLHESRKGVTGKTKEIREQYKIISKALDEAGNLDDKVYSRDCLINQLKGERNLWYQKFKEAERQMEATRKAWESV